MKVDNTSLDGVKLITPDTMFEDYRGTYTEIYNRVDYQYNPNLPNIGFVSDDVSVSRMGVLRGIHGDDKTWKLVSCLYGVFYLVVLNYDEESKQYGEWEGFTLSDRNRRQVLIPPRFGNGHLVMTDVAVFHYKQSKHYDRESQFTVKWDDDRFNIFWPMIPNILSSRDSPVW